MLQCTNAVKLWTIIVHVGFRCFKSHFLVSTGHRLACRCLIYFQALKWIDYNRCVYSRQTEGLGRNEIKRDRVISLSLNSYQCDYL